MGEVLAITPSGKSHVVNTMVMLGRVSLCECVLCVCEYVLCECVCVLCVCVSMCVVCV